MGRFVYTNSRGFVCTGMAPSRLAMDPNPTSQTHFDKYV